MASAAQLGADSAALGIVGVRVLSRGARARHVGHLKFEHGTCSVNCKTQKHSWNKRLGVDWFGGLDSV
jgi:hypothetical protein